jgi:hypothetical protein
MARWVTGINLLMAMMTTHPATSMATTIAGKKEATIITNKSITGLATMMAAA